MKLCKDEKFSHTAIDDIHFGNDPGNESTE